jgi:hypothetical protein
VPTPEVRQAQGVGLHNPNDWRYHQKAGNLFNTYLGKAPPPVLPASSPTKKRPVRNFRPPVRLNPRQSSANDLVSFLQYNATVGEANQFLVSVARSKGLSVRPRKNPWGEIDKLVRTHLTNVEIERYLTELRRRKATNEPLVRARRAG